MASGSASQGRAHVLSITSALAPTGRPYGPRHFRLPLPCSRLPINTRAGSSAKVRPVGQDDGRLDASRSCGAGGRPAPPSWPSRWRNMPAKEAGGRPAAGRAVAGAFSFAPTERSSRGGRRGLARFPRLVGTCWRSTVSSSARPITEQPCRSTYRWRIRRSPRRSRLRVTEFFEYPGAATTSAHEVGRRQPWHLLLCSCARPEGRRPGLAYTVGRPPVRGERPAPALLRMAKSARPAGRRAFTSLSGHHAVSYLSLATPSPAPAWPRGSPPVGTGDEVTYERTSTRPRSARRSFPRLRLQTSKTYDRPARRS